MKTKKSSKNLQRSRSFTRMYRIIFVLAFAAAGVALLLITHAANDTYPVYRLYNGGNNDHFYTPSASERDKAVNTYGYTYEGIEFYGCSSSSSGAKVVYRVYASSASDHFYTTDSAERDRAVQGGYVDETYQNSTFYTCSTSRSDAIPIYRLVNGTQHFYTSTTEGRDNAIKYSGYTYEGIGFYGSNGHPAQPPPPPSSNPSPSTPPPSTSTPSPSTSTPRTNPVIQGPSTNTTNINNSATTTAAPDTTSPSVPNNFQAVADNGKTYAQLGWDASTDDSGVKGYEIDRSTDQQNWVNLKSDITDTSYQDSSTAFNNHYFYRLRAKDNNNNLSDYTYAEVTTPNFAGNVTPGQDSVVHNDANTIIAHIPAGAVDSDAQCNVADNNEILSPNLDGYRTVSGPFQILCKKNDNSVTSKFNKPVTIEWKIVPPKDTGSLKYYVYTNNNWQPVTIKSHNAKTHTDSFVLGIDTTFIALGKIKHTPFYVKILEILGVIVILLLAAAAFLYRRYRSRQQATIDDYWRKMSGG